MRQNAGFLQASNITFQFVDPRIQLQAHVRELHACRLLLLDHGVERSGREHRVGALRKRCHRCHREQ